MKLMLNSAVAAGMLALSACGGQGDDKLGEQAQEAMENKADTLDAMAENSTGAMEDSLEAQADLTREAGDDKEEAIDDADVNADAMTNTQKEQVVNGM